MSPVARLYECLEIVRVPGQPSAPAKVIGVGGKREMESLARQSSAPLGQPGSRYLREVMPATPIKLPPDQDMF